MATRTTDVSPSTQRARDVLIAAQRAEREAQAKNAKRVQHVLDEVERERARMGAQLGIPPTARSPESYARARQDAFEEALERGVLPAYDVYLNRPPPSSSATSRARVSVYGAPAAPSTRRSFQPSALPPPVAEIPIEIPSPRPASVRPAPSVRQQAPVAALPQTAPTSYREGRRACSTEMVQQALQAAGQNKSRAARTLGISRQGLYKILARSA